MLRRSCTATLEKNESYMESFDIEPCEVGWVSGALRFVRVVELDGQGAVLHAQPQRSSGGLVWCGMAAEPRVIDEPGLHSGSLREFGRWLGRSCGFRRTNPRVKLVICLALKE